MTSISLALGLLFLLVWVPKKRDIMVKLGRDLNIDILIIAFSCTTVSTTVDVSWEAPPPPDGMEYFDEDEAILIPLFFPDMACPPRLGTCLAYVSERCGVTVGR